MDTSEFRRYIDRCVELYIMKTNSAEVLSEDDKKERIREKSIEDYQNRVFEEDVFVCYGCGEFVHKKGDLLNKEDLIRFNKIVDEYGYKLIDQTYGSCCYKDGWY